ncbi:hypothetical protein C343_05661 [Cryptococcus neoformans C23]|uniref:Pentatricopeptide repeat protein n=1 Tax=Cryptococcus neoformans (strain H99 / ATCC 208821 / CBS 10515 / FGSC 9487) TaxID=235443 RepID=J9VTE1_CRYN9|nr:hypothetical protein CNAG_04700 [Cryptococcus neoformans var. grubii H99]AFR97518.1 hypothetical protein CNAG_04700 [Cryptococcus neoformans var. grubii H99]AUB27548.1 hypothetical protein CKF44_04700 [Cryptococcus neoformans var. grubii]OWZ40438.1 hypothetical protein C343_05661 [Cryptococcus neoformans var. grubii C23]|eukprot:XP_012052153.1 hypothetical protein CNAG_04700 [Cryptococcus neoformans var. grubii H99]
MASGLGVRAVRSLGQAGGISSGRRLCPACLVFRDIQARQYNHGPSSRQARSSEFAPTPLKPTKSAPKVKVADSLLRAQFQTIFHNPTKSIDSHQALHAAYPLIFRRNIRPLLDPHTKTIPLLVAPILQQADTTDEERRQALVLLGHCYGKVAVDLLFMGPEVQHVAEVFAWGLMLEANRFNNDREKLPVLQDILEPVLKRLANNGATPVLQAPIVAAWVVLRSKTGTSTVPGNAYIWPPQASIAEYLGKVIPAGETVDSYRNEIETLLGKSEEIADRIPRSKDALDSELASMRNRGDWSGIINLWGRVRAGMRDGAVQRQVGILDPSPEVRFPVLASFLLAFKRPFVRSASLSVIINPPPTSFNTCASQVLAKCPRPLPRTIAYTLIFLRVRPDDNVGLRAGHEVMSLDMDERSDASENALENLKATWKETGERDLKMYMMYIEGLGRLGDLHGLQQAWNELVIDEECKKIYLHEERLPSKASFPPIHALNQMISACLLIPNDGPPLALDLFSQASRPDSAIPCNLITINTVLRHYAREANIEAMSALFNKAGELKLQPDVVTYTTLVQGLLRARRLDLAKGAMDAMQKQGIVPNERMCSMLIADLAKPGTRVGLEHAEEMLKLMHQKNMQTNEVTWTALASGYFRGGWEADGWEALARMNRLGIKLHRVGYNMLLKQATGSVDSNGGDDDVETIMKLWRRMLHDGVIPNSDSYLIVLTKLVQMDRRKEIEEVMREMRQRGFRPEKGALVRIVESISRRR